MNPCNLDSGCSLHPAENIEQPLSKLVMHASKTLGSNFHLCRPSNLNQDNTDSFDHIIKKIRNLTKSFSGSEKMHISDINYELVISEINE